MDRSDYQHLFIVGRVLREQLDITSEILSRCTNDDEAFMHDVHNHLDIARDRLIIGFDKSQFYYGPQALKKLDFDKLVNEKAKLKWSTRFFER